MKKISINKKYALNLEGLQAEEVKNIVLALLKEDFTGLKSEVKMLAEIIYADNINLSNQRKLARLGSSNTLISYPQQTSYPQQQNEQNAQNKQTFPPTSPLSRLTSNKNIINQEAPVGSAPLDKDLNCFNQHLDKCGRVRERTDEERELLNKVFANIFEDISKSLKANDEIVLKNVCLIEVIDTVIELMEVFETQKTVKFGRWRITKESIARLLISITYEDIYPLLRQLSYRTDLRNRPYYILSVLIQIMKSKGEDL